MLNVQEIQDLIKQIDESSIEEFTYEMNGTKLAIKKSLKQKEDTSNRQTSSATKGKLTEEVERKAIEGQTVEKVGDDPSEKEVVNEQAYDYEIKSPMVGTFYRSSNPESAPYVQKGDSVKKETVVCIVEAMKLFNEIEAETTGEIVEILVENGELVEYGQPLFRVKTK